MRGVWSGRIAGVRDYAFCLCILLAAVAAPPLSAQTDGSGDQSVDQTEGAGFRLLSPLRFVGRALDALASDGDTDPAVPEDQRATYRVAVVGMAGRTLSDQLQPAVGALPELIRDELRSYSNRTIPQWEVEEIRSVLTRDAIVQARIQYDRRIQRLDGVLFETGEAPVRASDSELQTLRRRIEFLSNLDKTRIPVPDHKPVTVVEEEIRFVRFLQDSSTLTDEYDADLVILLNAEQLGSLVLVKLESVYRVRPEREEVARTVAAPEELSSAIAEVFPELRREVTGVIPSVLAVRAEDDQGSLLSSAEILVDGKIVGRGAAVVEELEPGNHTVRVRMPSGVTVQRSVTTVASERREESIQIATTGGDFVLLDSVPTGAAVYRQAEWVGTTPMRLARPMTPRLYSLKKDGFLESRLTLHRQSPDQITRNLTTDDVDFEANVEEARERFYKAFGLFAVSLAMPVTLNGVYTDISGLFPGNVPDPDLSDEEQDRLYRRAQTVFYGYYGSLTLSAGLFGNMIWKLVDYLQVGQGYHER